MSLRPAIGIVFSVCFGLTGCGAHLPEPFTPSEQPTAQFPNIGYATWTNNEPLYRLYPGDVLDVQTPSAPELSKTVTVQPDGRISLPLLPPVMVADHSVFDAESIISRAYASQLLRPEVIISVKSAPLKVFIGGEVDKPGVYDMPGDINALQAVIMAGGFKTSAKRDQVVIIRRGPGGQAMMRTANLLLRDQQSRPNRRRAAAAVRRDLCAPHQHRRGGHIRSAIFPRRLAGTARLRLHVRGGLCVRRSDPVISRGTAIRGRRAGLRRRRLIPFPG